MNNNISEYVNNLINLKNKNLDKQEEKQELLKIIEKVSFISDKNKELLIKKFEEYTLEQIIEFTQQYYKKEIEGLQEEERTKNDINSIIIEKDKQENKLLNIKTEKQLKDYEKKIDSLEKKYEIKTKKLNISTNYPFLYDKNFNEKIYKKYEFNKYKNYIINQIYTDEFNKTKTQNIVSNYISLNTPYNGLLLFHGVGTGKTCAAVSIAEQFKDYVYENDKNIYIFTPSETLTEQWKNEIFNYDKYISSDGLDTQCTGTDYTSLVKKFNVRNISKEKVNKKIQKIISKYYKFYGYRKFANNFKKITKDLSIKDKILYVKNNYSNCVFILDEVHFIRDNNKENKDIIPTLKFIARYSNNCKFILLSATPMYNSSNEIELLLNILLLNDNRSPITKSFFDKNNNLIEKKTEEFKKILTGYVSYIRGENPETFPIKLYPKNSELIQDVKGIQFVKLPMQSEQLKKYNVISQDIIDDEEFDVDENLKNNFRQNTTMCSNIVFPTNLFGNEGFESCIDFVKKNKYNLNKNSFIDDKSFLDISNLHKYSIKFSKIIKNIEKSQGIVFIYSRFLNSGIIPLALALEVNGYNNYSNNNLLKKYGNKGNYILLTGSTEKKILNEYVKACNDTNNLEGERIKIILGSGAIEQGLNFKRIREVHIIDPWFHFFRMDQIIGRAFRNMSHKLLPLEKQNVNIFLYIAFDPNSNEISNDEFIYNSAYTKDKQIQKIIYLLKTNSIDCNLTKNENIFNKSIASYGFKKIIDSQGILRYDVNSENNEFNFLDIDKSRECNYENCNYLCNPDLENNLEIDELDFNTMSYFELYEINDIKKIIINIYKSNYIFEFNEIHKIIKNEYNKNVKDIYIYIALEELIKSKKEFINNNNIKGFINYNNEYYVFQPTYLKNTNLNIEYRNLLKNNYIHIDDNIFKESFNNLYIQQEISDDFSILKFEEDIDNYDNIIIDKYYKKSFLTDFIDLDNMKLIYSFMKIDRYNIDNKCKLIEHLLNNFIEKSGISIEDNIKNIRKDKYLNIIYLFFKNQIIFEKFMYWIVKKKKKDFYYFNNDKFIPYDKEKLLRLPKSITNIDNYKIDNDNQIYGCFINGYFKYFDNRKYFKTKEKMNKSRGLKCNINDKKKIVDIINFIVSPNIIKESTIGVYKKNSLDDRSICNEFELLLRYYDNENITHPYNNKKMKWFYNSFESLLK